jgi:hypothetical protein
VLDSRTLDILVVLGANVVAAQSNIARWRRLPVIVLSGLTRHSGCRHLDFGDGVVEVGDEFVVGEGGTFCFGSGVVGAERPSRSRDRGGAERPAASAVSSG